MNTLEKAALSIIGVLIALTALVFGINHYAEGERKAGYAEAAAKYEKEKVTASAAVLDKTDANSKQATGATNDHTKQLQNLRVDHDRALSELDILRDALAKRGDGETNANASAQRDPARDELFRAMGEVVDSLSTEGARIAREASGHAADSLMYQRAWPR
jgi:lipopolysaccharide export LptBFGC system permease protein LptF